MILSRFTVTLLTLCFGLLQRFDQPVANTQLSGPLQEVLLVQSVPLGTQDTQHILDLLLRVALFRPLQLADPRCKAANAASSLA